MGPGAGQGRGGGLTLLGVGCWLQEPALKVTVFDLLRCRAVGHTALKKPLTPAEVKVPAVGTRQGLSVAPASCLSGSLSLTVPVTKMLNTLLMWLLFRKGLGCVAF